MRITDIEVIPLRVPYESPNPEGVPSLRDDGGSDGIPVSYGLRIGGAG